MNQAVTKSQIHAQARGESASQATVIEQSRAIAEVQGMLIVAQQRPRDQAMAVGRVREACQQWSLAEVAFFKFPRGGETVAGESIHLAVELARCWGNIDYGIKELSRSDVAGESEMLAFAWDLETNTRSEMGFLVPHRRDTRNGPKALTDMRDIYENNANMGARRLRECIFRVLPTYVREIAKDTCIATLENGQSEQPLAVRIAVLFEQAEKQGISRARIEAKLGKSLTAVDAAGLHVSLRSIKRGEVSAEEEFPRIGVEEATNAARRVADQTRTSKEAEPEPSKKKAETAKEETAPKLDLDDDAWRTRADEIIDVSAKITSARGLADLMALRSSDIAAMPEDYAEEVNAALERAGERIAKASK